MPEFAEVEFFRKRWALAAPRAKIVRVLVHEKARIYRGTSAAAIRDRLTGATLVESATAAKQMIFRFVPAGTHLAKEFGAVLDRAAAGDGLPSDPPRHAMARSVSGRITATGASKKRFVHGGAPRAGRPKQSKSSSPSNTENRGCPSLWLGVHLGMSGDMVVARADYEPGRHDHLVLYTAKHALVLEDPRMFGRVQFAEEDAPPTWWTSIAPAILSKEFTVQAVAAFLKRRGRAPIKAVLLMQERFPGVGNWMADEILWRAAIHPRRKAGALKPAEIARLWKECRQVCRQALVTIAGKGNHLPKTHNARVPNSWLLPHRWEPGGHCPKAGVPLARATIGGRTTVWSPARQKLPRNG